MMNKEEITIRCELRPGDVGLLIHMHGWIYANECGYNHRFEGYVCHTFHDFLEHYSPDKDRLWFAEADGKMIGAIAIVGRSPDKAQLRWFILHPEYRGRGLGRRLMSDALEYCKATGYKEVFLETTEEQQAAIKMYVSAGFRKVAEVQNHTWGKVLTEQTYELNLD
jgi:ribosomal protein S18 acetylase RimI-like enzyme